MSGKIRVLDLCSGSGSATQAFKDRKHDVYSVDIEPKFKPDLVFDVSKLSADFLRGFDFVWASPPCQAFSVASIGTHWTGGRNAYIPKTQFAKDSIRLVRHIQRIIGESGVEYWVMENPRGVLRKVIGMPEWTVSYCRYGDERMKPTDLWGNLPEGFTPRMCHNGNPDHTPAPRGAKTGTQGRKGAFERSKVPYALSLSICKLLENSSNKKPKEDG